MASRAPCYGWRLYPLLSAHPHLCEEERITIDERLPNAISSHTGSSSRVLFVHFKTVGLLFPLSLKAPCEKLEVKSDFAKQSQFNQVGGLTSNYSSPVLESSLELSGDI